MYHYQKNVVHMLVRQSCITHINSHILLARLLYKIKQLIDHINHQLQISFVVHLNNSSVYIPIVQESAQLKV